MKCRKCKIEMVDGVAIAQTWKPGLPDFPGQTDLRGRTMTPGGPGRIANVQKCPQCGYSVEIDLAPEDREPK